MNLNKRRLFSVGIQLVSFVSLFFSLSTIPLSAKTIKNTDPTKNVFQTTINVDEGEISAFAYKMDNRIISRLREGEIKTAEAISIIGKKKAEVRIGDIVEVCYVLPKIQKELESNFTLGIQVLVQRNKRIFEVTEWDIISIGKSVKKGESYTVGPAEISGKPSESKPVPQPPAGEASPGAISTPGAVNEPIAISKPTPTPTPVPPPVPPQPEPPTPEPPTPEPGSPTAVISASPTSGDAPLTVSFDGSGSTAESGSIASYSWDFGDSSTATGALTSHIYNSQGAYIATLVVTDTNGKTGSATVSISVSLGKTYYYVDPDPAKGSDSNDGSDQQPWKTITHALATYDASIGTTIHLAAGTYSAATNGETFPLTITDKSNLIIKGDTEWSGHAVTLTKMTVTPITDTVTKSTAIIDANSTNGVFWIENSDSITIQNLQIQNSNQTTATPFGPFSICLGGGIGCLDSSLTVESCNFRNNVVYSGVVGTMASGGAIAFAQNSLTNKQLTISHCGIGLDENYATAGNSAQAAGAGAAVGGGIALIDFTGGGTASANISNTAIVYNEADGGGGNIVAMSFNNLNITNCLVAKGETTDKGGGIYLGYFFGVTPTANITDTYIADNIAEQGGGLCSEFCPLTLNRCKIYDNQATGTGDDGGGGGLVVFAQNGKNNDVTLTNCLINDNYSEYWGGGVAIFADAGVCNVTMKYCTLYHNQNTGTGTDAGLSCSITGTATGTLDVQNSLFINNEDYGISIRAGNTATISITYCNACGNPTAEAIAYGITAGHIVDVGLAAGWAPTTGTVHPGVDPVITIETEPTTLASYYAFGVGSPTSVKEGALVIAVTNDIAGTSRHDPNPSMGCYERSWGGGDPAITGRIYDSITGELVSSPTVAIYKAGSTSALAVSTSNPYAFSVDPGRYYFAVNKDGYGFPSEVVEKQVTGDHGDIFTANEAQNINIPIDADGFLKITKTVNKVKAEIGDIITYNIKVENKHWYRAVDNVILYDEIVNGFKYIKGSTYKGTAQFTDNSVQLTGHKALFNLGTVSANTTLNYSYQVRVSTGIAPGKYKAAAICKKSDSGKVISNQSVVATEIVGNPLFDTGTILGKVFYDLNGNGIQDKPLTPPSPHRGEAKGEPSIAGVRIATEYGVVVETDRDGKYHIPNVLPGIHLLKVDKSSLPEGAVFTPTPKDSEQDTANKSENTNQNKPLVWGFTTDNPYVVKMTEGLLAKVSFGVKPLTPPSPQRGEDVRSTGEGASNFFIVALADGIIRDLKTSGNIEMVEKDNRYDKGLKVDGRLAYYLKGKVLGKYLITSSLDTDRLPSKTRQRYDSISLKKLFTNLDPDKYYPIYGDASTIDYSAADTQDVFYVLVEWDESHLKWGSFNTSIPLYNRTLSGGEVEYSSVGKTKYSDTKTQAKGFYAISRQIPAHDEFLGTGGSLYYLRHRDVIEGSEKVRAEVRDRISKVAIQRIELTEGVDYEIDYDTGRIILKKPLNGVNNRYTSTIISNDILAGERIYLVADYEYFSTDVGSNDTWGGRASQWVGNHVRVGGTYIKENRGDIYDADTDTTTDLDPYELYGGEGTLKINEDTQIDVSYNHSKETQLEGNISWDGGFSFSERDSTSSDNKSGNAFGISGVTKLKIFGSTDILLSYSRQDPYFSATDSLTTQGTQKYIANIIDNITDNFAIGINHITQKLLDATIAQNITGNTNTHTTTAFLDYRKNKWDARLEYQHQEVTNPITDYSWFGQTFLSDNDFIAGRLGYQLTERLHPYVRAQGTISGKTNNQGTAGLDILLFKDTTINIGETVGTQGNSTLLGIVSRVDEDTDMYTNLEIGNLQEQGKFTKTTYGQSTALDKKGSKIYAQTDYSSYNENCLQGNVIGYEKKIGDSFGIGATYERSQLDNISNAINRDSGSVSLSYLNVDLLKLYTKLELREDKGNGFKRRQWLTSNDATWYITKDLSVLGRANWALTEDVIQDSDEARFHEMGAGLAYRPINFDRLHLLGKYSYITDLPPGIQNDFVEETDSRKHIYALEGAFDINKYLQLVGKLAYRDMAEKVGPRDWTQSNTLLYIGRFNFHISNMLPFDERLFLARGWDLGVEYRCLSNHDSEDKKTGWLVELDKELFKYAMVGVGYNFTKYDDDLSNDDDYDAQGFFVRLLGKY